MRYAKVDKRIWGDEKFHRLSRDGKLLFLYLLTSESLGSLPGLLRVSRESIRSELGFSPHKFGGLWETVSDMVSADWDAKLIWVRNAIRYNLPENPNVIKSWQVQWDELPECGLKSEVRKVFRKTIENHKPEWVTVFDTVCPTVSDTVCRIHNHNRNRKPSPLSPPLQGGEKNAAFAAEQKLQNATAWVCQELGLAGRDIRNVVAAALEQEAKTSTEEIQTIAKMMVRSRRSYDAHPRGSFHALPSKFFAEGIWKASREYTQHSNPADVPRPRPASCMMPGCDKPARERDRFCSDTCKQYAQKLEQRIESKGNA